MYGATSRAPRTKLVGTWGTECSAGRLAAKNGGGGVVVG